MLYLQEKMVLRCGLPGNQLRIVKGQRKSSSGSQGHKPAVVSQLKTSKGFAPSGTDIVGFLYGCAA